MLDGDGYIRFKQGRWFRARGVGAGGLYPMYSFEVSDGLIVSKAEVRRIAEALYTLAVDKPRIDNRMDADLFAAESNDRWDFYERKTCARLQLLRHGDGFWFSRLGYTWQPAGIISLSMALRNLTT